MRICNYATQELILFIHHTPPKCHPYNKRKGIKPEHMRI